MKILRLPKIVVKWGAFQYVASNSEKNFHIKRKSRTLACFFEQV